MRWITYDEQTSGVETRRGYEDISTLTSLSEATAPFRSTVQSDDRSRKPLVMIWCLQQLARKRSLPETPTNRTNV